MSPVWRRSESVFFVFWILCLFQIVTITSLAPFVFAAPWSREHVALLALYLVSSLCWLERFRTGPLVLFHLPVVLILLLLHPLTLVFGRDGALVVIGVYFLLALYRLTSIPRRYVLLSASMFASVLVLETFLSTIDGARAGEGLKDYGDLTGEYGEGGFLIPDLDLTVVGERGEARFITNRFGFRNRRSVEYAKSEQTYRILLIGDSFVAGYRTDQDETLGQVLEDELASSEVLIAGAGHPGAYFEYMRNHGLKFHPDLILVGITLGNDISHSYAARHGLVFEKDVMTGSLLPAGAFKRSYLERLPLRVDRSLRSWRAYRLLSRVTGPEPIGSWLQDHPLEVHSFDAIHSLGHFYGLHPIPIVEESYQALLHYMSALDSLCRQNEVELVFFLIPQRFQVNDRDWRATTFAYALEESAFDLESPNRRIMGWCRERGVSCLDLLPAFRRASGDLYLPLGDMHWNAAGQRLAAIQLKEYLVERPSGSVSAGTEEAASLR